MTDIASILAHNEQSAAALARRIGFDKKVERIVDGITEASEQALAKSRVGHTLGETTSPEGVMDLNRVWREVDAMMGPGRSILQVMLARYGRLGDTAERMNMLLRQGVRARTKSARIIVLAKMESELRAFAKLKGEIAALVEQSVDPVRSKLEAEFTEEFSRGLKEISSKEINSECRKALDEMERSLQAQRDALKKGVDARPSTAALKRRANALVTRLKATRQTGERAVINARIRKLAEFGDPQKLGAEFSKQIKRRVGRALPALHDIEDSAIVFMDALGVVASAKPANAPLLRRYIEEGAYSLSKKELKRIAGYLGNLRGLMPEEVAIRMGFCNAMFHKAAFETLADFPSALRKQMQVEIVEGPLWVLGTSGPARQFGDGSVLLTDPGGQSAIIGLGEIKAGFDAELLEQLLVRSDRRAIVATVIFVDADGKEQIRKLTREFAFEGAKEPVSLQKPPIYVHASPRGETAETAAQFKEMVNNQMQNGRELWKIQLPFDATSNELFVNESLKEAVKILKSAKKRWGH